MHTKAGIIAAEALVRDGIRSMLSIDRTVDVVGESASFADIPQVRRRGDPDVFVIDASGLRGTGEVHAQRIRSLVDMAERPVVLLADDGVQCDTELLRLGACVLARSRVGSADLVSSVRLLAAGYLPVERRLAQQLAHRALEERAGEAAHVRLLTPRERDVFHLLARGRSNMEIAASLTLAHSTVKTHVRGILKKLGLTSRLDVVILVHGPLRRPLPSTGLRHRARGRATA
ncbi:LuxR C-terminal-related transcriptional regulator [Streptomyces griseoluteus]|uniref:response regulator transcription factor n=1 Tax=Streptomyces griseoluteus TaxID=29306 RepID=UPI0033316830